MLHDLDSDDLSALLRIRPGISTILSQAEPTDVAAWWLSIDSAQQDALIAAIPAIIGNLGGVAYVARDRANRIWLEDQLDEARRTLQTVGRPLPWWQAGIPEIVAAHDIKVDAARDQLKALQNIDDALKPSISGAERFLVTLSSDTPPLAAVSVGNIDTADNVTYAAPGMGTTTAAGIQDWVSGADNIADGQSQSAPHLQHAVVAWVGYETPPVPGDGGLQVFGTEYAKAGAAQLGSALAGLEATRPDAQLNLVAHSYGTTTSSIALTQAGTQVDTFVSLGSAGLPPEVDHASDLHADQVLAGQAQDVWPLDPAGGDQWAWAGRLSPEHPINPIDDSFGANAFGTNGGAGGTAVTDHSTHTDSGGGYLDVGTESLRNVVMATAGQPGNVSPHVTPEPTPFQRSLMNGASHGYSY